MTAPTGSAADRAFGEEDSDVTPAEIAAMKLAGERIGKRVGRKVATRFATAQTIEVLNHLVEVLPDWASAVTIEEVRKDRTLIQSGQPSKLFNGVTVDPELAQKAADLEKEKAELAKQVEDLTKAAAGNGGGTLGLGAATGIDAQMATMRALGEANPVGFAFVIKLLEAFAKLSHEEQGERSVFAGSVVTGTNGYEIVDDTVNGGRAPKILVDAYAESKAKQDALNTANNGGDATALADANKKLDKSIKDSIGWKAAEYDKDHDDKDPKSLVSLAKPFTLPTSVVTAYNNAKGAVDNIGGTFLKGKDDALRAINALGGELKPFTSTK